MYTRSYRFETPLFIKPFMRHVYVSAVDGPFTPERIVLDSQCASRYKLWELSYDSQSKWRAKDESELVDGAVLSSTSIASFMPPAGVVHSLFTMLFVCVANGESSKYLDNILFGHLQVTIGA